MPFTLVLTAVKRKRLHIVTTVSILAFLLSAVPPLAFAQFGSASATGGGKSGKRISFQGYLQGSEVDTLQGNPPETISVHGNVIGIATHLGKFTFSYNDTVRFTEGSATGDAELITDNGDRLFITLVGQGESTDADTPTLNSIVEIDTITGGSGRFAGAIGTFTTKRLVDLATGFTSGSVQGTILLPRPSRGNH